MKNCFYPFENLPLDYAYNALEPFIDEKTMHLHHDKHLQTYIDNLNKTLESFPQLQKRSLEQLVRGECVPKCVATPIRNNAGGVYNHRFFFDGLSPNGDKTPSGKLSDAINHQFSSFESFKEKFKEAALSVFGSGYAWLVLDSRCLKIVTTPNQNSPLCSCTKPLLTIDVWEHAYYLMHNNRRAEYIDSCFNVVDWGKVGERYA